MLYIFSRKNSLRIAWGATVTDSQPVRWEQWSPLSRGTLQVDRRKR